MVVALRALPRKPMHPLPASHHKLMVPPLAQRAQQTLLLTHAKADELHH